MRGFARLLHHFERVFELRWCVDELSVFRHPLLDFILPLSPFFLLDGLVLCSEIELLLKQPTLFRIFSFCCTALNVGFEHLLGHQVQFSRLELFGERISCFNLRSSFSLLGLLLLGWCSFGLFDDLLGDLWL